MNNESISNSSSKEGTPTGSASSSQRPISTMQPHEVKLLAQRMSNEFASAKAVGVDTEKGKQHMQKFNAIRNILIKYKESQGKSGVVSNSNTGSPAPSPLPSSTSANATPNQSSQPSRSQSIEPNSSQSANSAPATINFNAVTIEKYNQIILRTQEMVKRVKNLEELKVKEANTSKVDEYNQEIQNLNQQIVKHQKAVNYIRAQLEKQGKLQAIDANSDKATPPPSASTIDSTKANPPNSVKAPSVVSIPASVKPSEPISNPSTVAASKPKGKPVPPTAPVVQPPIKTTTNTFPQSKVANANAPLSTAISGTTSVTVPTSIPQTNNLNSHNSQSTTNLPSMVNRTASSINARGLTGTAGASKLNGNARPGLAGGATHDAGFTSMPAFNRFEHGAGAQMPNNIPNNGGRVLTKRKLVELVNSIGVEEGDQKTIVDNDVEDILLDLADEFVTSVTGFACKLAKHRKMDKLDIRDFQLHLERNWALRVPGYALDEIKSVRKWQPNPEYKENVAKIEKSELENGNSK
ncbi:transcription initiation factor TFIID subunit A-domain-containing protein [Scheffersomyces coipomensis]|uniref:transcription initiation factor TFIID subunit A-domain-containing protein n=1 Tax=Scheffersomyces coipomensis TaxID=1788519 RepID=UPI00315CAEE1